MNTTNVTNTPSTDLRSVTTLAFAMIVLGSTGVFSVMSGQPTFNVVFFRCLFGAISLALWCMLTSQLNGLARIDRRLFPLILLSGFFLVTNWAALFEAYRLISIGFVTIIYHLQTFWIVVFAALFLNEKISKAKGAWLLLAFLGLIAVIWPRLGDIAGDQNWLTGVCFALLASLLYAGSTLTSRALKLVPPTYLTIIHCLFGVVVFAPFVSVEEIAAASETALLLMIALGTLHTGMGYIMIYSSYPRLSVATIGICAFLNPLAAVGFGYAFLDETMNAAQILGAVVVGVAGIGVTLGWGERQLQR